MTQARTAALVELGPTWMLDPAVVEGPAAGADALHAAFGRRVPLLLDVGVGNGDATRAWAAANPGRDVVAVELHRPGIVNLLRCLDAEGPANVRILEADVTLVVPALPAGAFEAVRVLFPDPWPKRRHHKRRLVDPAFVAAATDLLVVGGVLHLATDWLDYADAMRVALAAEGRLEWVVDHDDGPALDPEGVPIDFPDRWRSSRPPRPVTVYEGRGLEAGRSVTDLVARRVR